MYVKIGPSDANSLLQKVLKMDKAAPACVLFNKFTKKKSLRKIRHPVAV